MQFINIIFYQFINYFTTNQTKFDRIYLLLTGNSHRWRELI